MEKEEHIESGMIELYLAGVLTDKENQQVYEAILEYPEVFEEVIQIEEAMIKLTAAIAKKPSDHLLRAIKEKLDLLDDESNPVIPINNTKAKSKANFMRYVGWAAAIIFAVGLLWKLNEISDLENQIKTADANSELLKDQLENTANSLSEADEFIAVVRDTNIPAITLAGQSVSPNSHAHVYWDRSSNQLYLDAAGMPEPPKGKVYQLWSLTLDPLTPTDMGVIQSFILDENKIFKVENPHASEAFGITLEPEGGSKSPTLEQLYVLGVVNS